MIRVERAPQAATIGGMVNDSTQPHPGAIGGSGITTGTAIVLLLFLMAVGFVAALFLAPKKPRLVIDPYTRKPVDLEMANTPADEYVKRGGADASGRASGAAAADPMFTDPLLLGIGTVPDDEAIRDGTGPAEAEAPLAGDEPLSIGESSSTEVPPPTKSPRGAGTER